MSRTLTYTATFTGRLSRCALATDPDDGTQPTASIEFAGTLSAPDAPAGAEVRPHARVRVERARKAHFSVHALEDETHGYLRLAEADFDFLLRALALRTDPRVEIVGAVEIDNHAADRTRFDVSYFELSVV